MGTGDLRQLGTCSVLSVSYTFRILLRLECGGLTILSSMGKRVRTVKRVRPNAIDLVAGLSGLGYELWH